MVRFLFYRIAILVSGFSLFLLIMTLFFRSATDSWLSPNDPLDAEVLIVEGWISPAVAGQVVDEFTAGSYEYIIATGAQFDKAYNLSQNGKVRFDLDAAGVDLNKGDTITFNLYAFGEPALGEYARYRIIYNEDTIGSNYTGPCMQRYIHHYAAQDGMPGEAFVLYDNDIYTESEDRNLHLWKLVVNGKTIPARSPYTRLIRGRGSGYTERPLNQYSLAGEKAYELIMAGLDSSRIIALEVPEVKRFRTYTDAVMVSEFFRETRNIPCTVNVFSQGNHARRSRLLYRYALPADINVGIIASEMPCSEGVDSFINSSRWFSTVRQLGSYLYIKVIFNPRRHYRRIMKENTGPGDK